MSEKNIPRRDFLKAVLAGIPALSLDWSRFPRRTEAGPENGEFDAVVIGSGLGGLSFAAALARQGFRPLVLEQHVVPGGYATTFRRKGGFVFDVSLHSTVVGERGGLHNLIPGFPEIDDVEFIPHPSLYRVIFPDYDIRVPQQDVPGYVRTLAGHFPEEKEGIEGLFSDMDGLEKDLTRYSQAGGQVDMRTMATEFAFLLKFFNKTWGAVVDTRLKNEKLKAVVSALWGYYGLPPSRLSSFYYALPTISYMKEGGYYPRGRSQKISDALVGFIRDKGGEVKLNTRVEKILVDDGAAYGVKTGDGQEFRARVVVSNANAVDTFGKLMGDRDVAADFKARMDKFSVSLSSFQVFLGLNKDLVGESGIQDSEIFCETGYDIEAGYKSCLEARVGDGGYGLTLYDNIYPGYSPPGKNTLIIISLQGFDHWQPYEADYRKGNKTDYRREKERMADVLIDKVEQTLLPGLRKAVQVREVGTPLTNVRYTSNTRGAIYGWDQTLDNTPPRRFPHRTPVKNLFLSGAWTNPGGGYGAVLSSGLECFAEVMKDWDG